MQQWINITNWDKGHPTTEKKLLQQQRNFYNSKETYTKKRNFSNSKETYTTAKKHIQQQRNIYNSNGTSPTAKDLQQRTTKGNKGPLIANDPQQQQRKFYNSKGSLTTSKGNKGPLKGQCHEIFDHFFGFKDSTWAPNEQAKTVS